MDEDKGVSRAASSADDDAERAALRHSWEVNAAAWTEAVRDHRIPSRRLATDAAVVAACERVLAESEGKRVLDVGCGEGWLARVLAERGAAVTGIDASAELIARARAGAHDAATEASTARFEVVSYEALHRDRSCVAGPFDLIVCNFALLDERAGETLSALRARLAASGRLIVQTVHPWAAMGEATYEDGWRLETFKAFEAPFPASMPWYFRSLGSWIRCASGAGLRLDALEEPLHPETARPLSLLLTFARDDPRQV